MKTLSPPVPTLRRPQRPPRCPEEHNSEASSDEAEEVGLALTSDMLPTNTTIQCLNTKTSWGREATTVSSRRCKISAAHCPAGCKVAVCLIDDLLPTSGGFQLDTEALWTTASRGGSVDRYLLVAMELNDGPENAEWRLWQFPMATDQRLVREIVAESGTELTDDLKKKLGGGVRPCQPAHSTSCLRRSRPRFRSTAGLSTAVPHTRR